MKSVEQFLNFLEENGVKAEHQVLDNGENKNECVNIGFSGENIPGMKFRIIFDPEGSGSAQIFCNEVCKFQEEKNLIMLQTVNILNAKYRWVTFYVMDGGIVNANASIAFTDDSANQILTDYLRHFVGVVDTAYPILMKALYAQE